MPIVYRTVQRQTHGKTQIYTQRYHTRDVGIARIHDYLSGLNHFIKQERSKPIIRWRDFESQHRNTPSWVRTSIRDEFIESVKEQVAGNRAAIQRDTAIADALREICATMQTLSQEPHKEGITHQVLRPIHQLPYILYPHLPPKVWGLSPNHWETDVIPYVQDYQAFGIASHAVADHVHALMFDRPNEVIRNIQFWKDTMASLWSPALVKAIERNIHMSTANDNTPFKQVQAYLTWKAPNQRDYYKDAHELMHDPALIILSLGRDIKGDLPVHIAHAKVNHPVADALIDSVMSEAQARCIVKGLEMIEQEINADRVDRYPIGDYMTRLNTQGKEPIEYFELRNRGEAAIRLYHLLTPNLHDVIHQLFDRPYRPYA